MKFRELRADEIECRVGTVSKQGKGLSLFNKMCYNMHIEHFVALGKVIDGGMETSCWI